MQAHFEDAQFENNRQDGKRFLRCDAVPTIFHHRPEPRRRKPPSKRGQLESPRKIIAAKRQKIEHNYCATIISSKLISIYCYYYE